MTDFKLRKVVVGGKRAPTHSNFCIDSIEKNTITIIRVGDGDRKYIEMEEWLTKHGATKIGYYNGYEFCPVYNVTDEIKVIFALRWA